MNFRVWGKAETMERLKAVNQMQSFIREAQALANEHEELKGEIYCNDTLSIIKRCSILPAILFLCRSIVSSALCNLKRLQLPHNLGLNNLPTV